jgi:hypothetical protein
MASFSLLFYLPLFSLVTLKIWTTWRFLDLTYSEGRPYSLLFFPPMLGGNVMRANFPEYRWLCGRGERRGKMAANQQSKWRPISLSLRTFTHHRLSIYWRIFPQSARSTQTEYFYFLFTSHFLFLIILGTTHDDKLDRNNLFAMNTPLYAGNQNYWIALTYLYQINSRSNWSF